ncbi:MAG: pirin family protein [Cytophagaceae bacterium]|nr:pirin family protein [Cytophagaceae bacterium]
MKKVIHKADSRGYADHGWLKTYHSFSFAGYYNPERVQYGLLRVLNDDTVAGGMGFGKHPHDNMEIVTIPLKGVLEHEDSMGNKKTIQKNEVQIMSAGTGIRHSEYNHSETEEVQLLQVWVFPKEKNIKPRYDQKIFSETERKNKFMTVVSPDTSEGALWINQDAYFSIGDLDSGTALDYKIKKAGNGVYVFLIEGSAEVAGEKLSRRDAIGISETDAINVKATAASTVLLIEVPMK